VAEEVAAEGGGEGAELEENVRSGREVGHRPHVQGLPALAESVVA